MAAALMFVLLPAVGAAVAAPGQWAVRLQDFGMVAGLAWATIVTAALVITTTP